MKDQPIDTPKLIIFPMDYNPNDILMSQVRDFWNSLSEEQLMRDHEIMMKNVEDLARQELEQESCLEARKS